MGAMFEAFHPEKVLAERQRRVFRDDRLAFIRHAGSNLRRRKIEPDRWQERLLLSNAKRIILNCSRQVGKSTMASGFALHKAMFTPESLVVLTAPTERQAKELFAKVSRFYLAVGGVVNAASVRRLGLELANGSRIEALPGNPETVQGYSPDLVIIDEAARIKDELYYGLRPSLAVTGGVLMMLSTPRGKRGVFWEQWDSGEGWERYEVPATECPRITPAYLAEERASVPARIFRQEFCCSFEETEDQLFSHEEVRSAMTDEVEPLFFGG